MLVDINLLPQKEQKKLGLLIILAILVGLFLLASILYYVQIHTAKDTFQSIDKQITMTKKIEEQLQKKQGSSASANSANQLKTAIDWADNNRIETIPVMRHLTALLPERGFIQTFTYNETGTVTITVQFDTPTEAANYLNSLNHSSWIEKVSLNSLNSSSSDSNSASTSSNQTNSTTTASNPASTSTEAIVDSNTNSATKNYLPRYTGQLEIQFNRDSVKKAIDMAKKNGSDEEGGFGS
ncbi:PilN domain-containing protein [Bacillus sp. EB600]|uniref:PilN domain-containing protein n=1 Tax=Bacillus sp. EB600 TaxID=2806345 RepID=UPI00210B0906|nr:PilN domain-containing protein [Bacillus sp. EB600]MCQ6278264.1 hypothetical protein [Bacillus sp. EB600]